ncbi:MAG TPA: transposase [Candidatus Dormibacteraeota bacterium]
MPRPDLDALSIAELKAVVVELFGRVAELTRIVCEQRDEIAGLKGLKGRSDIKPPSKPSGMAQVSQAKVPSHPRRGGDKTAKRVVAEVRILEATVPPGSRFKGYEDFVVQDLVLRPQVVRYRRERWLTSDGRTVIAPLPASVRGHFGAELRRFVLVQHHQGQVTVARLVEQLRAIGIDVSKRQVVRVLIDGQDVFLDEARDVLRAGLETASWISVDDTGARHQGKNAVCTQIGNDHFAWFGTTGSKSRLNFLELLRAGHTDYVVNAEALAYMRERALSGPVIASLAGHAQRRFPDPAAWTAHLQHLGITDLAVTPDPVRIATEGALFGSIKAHGFIGKAVIVSDDAGQFDVGHHALCWVHAERLVHKLDAFTEHGRMAQQTLQSLIWWFYRDLLAYKREPSPRRKAEMRTRFDRIFRRRTGFVTLDRLLARLHANKAELLAVLDRPEIPLHTNGSEQDIRCHVTKRKISGGTRSDRGRDCRDAFLGLAKTCMKLGIAFWDYLGERLKIPEQPEIPSLPAIIRNRSAAA